ncbi:unnamed protein product [Brachionus calyciflorus]|uniref:Uncharacterized protein n=1 Tax=Brachionus calyciflorus TaxID=104777 RepID=A0A814HSB4_9BILA|nr:unnamed protein product [Brachionus calyciflorus]
MRSTPKYSGKIFPTLKNREYMLSKNEDDFSNKTDTTEEPFTCSKGTSTFKTDSSSSSSSDDEGEYMSV